MTQLVARPQSDNGREAYQPPEISILRLPQSAAQWDLVVDFLRLRKQVFINKKKWRLVEKDEIEYEQYDTATVATYVIAHRGNQVLGGARLLRCDTVIGSARHAYSYMIRDAYLGMIDLPSEICSAPPPVHAASWELTRLVSIDDDARTARLILDEANNFIKSVGGTQCLFLGPPGFLRMARSYGYAPEKLGKICGDESGRFLAFSCAVI